MSAKRKRGYLRPSAPPRYPCDGCYGRAACDGMKDGEGGVCWSWYGWFRQRWPEVCGPFRERAEAEAALEAQKGGNGE